MNRKNVFLMLFTAGLVFVSFSAKSNIKGDLKNYSSYLKGQNSQNEKSSYKSNGKKGPKEKKEEERSFKESKGVLEIKDYSQGSGKNKITIASMKVKYQLYTLMKEPCELFSLKWIPETEGTELHWVKFRAMVIYEGGYNSKNFAGTMYVYFSPGVDDPGKWSWDIAGSSSWGKQFKYSDGSYAKAESVMEAFREGFTLGNLEVVDIGLSKKKEEKEKKRLWDKIKEKFAGKKEDANQAARDETNPFKENKTNPFENSGQNPFETAKSDPFAAVENDNPFEQQIKEERRLAEIRRKEEEQRRLCASFEVNIPRGEGSHTYAGSIEHSFVNTFRGKFSPELFSKNVRIRASINGNSATVNVENDGAFSVKGTFKQGRNNVRVVLTANGGIYEVRSGTINYKFYRRKTLHLTSCKY